jgi:hypothetical protein
MSDCRQNLLFGRQHASLIMQLVYLTPHLLTWATAIFLTQFSKQSKNFAIDAELLEAGTIQLSKYRLHILCESLKGPSDEIYFFVASYLNR